MLFNPQFVLKKEGSFEFYGDITAVALPCFAKNVFKEFWNNFSFKSSKLEIFPKDEFIFSIGDAEKIELDGCDYSINIEKNGLCIFAKDEPSLIRGFMTLLDRFCASDGAEGLSVKIDCCEIRDSACLQNRMVHFCVFPETELWELHQFVRLCGALKYTHLVLEFWGMLQYDCMKELAWSHAFSKEQIRPIIQEANDLGLEIIPMFNHWGHATASRVKHGKHVVLDQNPTLQTYFSDDGWCWDIAKPKVKDLMRKIRSELIDLCGSGNYFHIGCDEAYNFDLSTKDSMNFICDYINEIAAELEEQGRTTIAWGDMFLYKYPHYNPQNYYECNAPSAESEQYMLSKLNKNIVIGDWQYGAKEAPVETTSVFVNAGFKTILCSWDRGAAELDACINTAKDKLIFGLMHTTWHTLSGGMPYVIRAGVKTFEKESSLGDYWTRTASLLRKVFPSNGEYTKSGWSRYQVGFLW